MGRQHIKDGLLSVRQQKTKTTLVIPITQPLREVLAAHPADNLTFLTTHTGKPFSPGGFSNWFGHECAEAGLAGLSAHGLRKAMCRRLAEAGRSVNQIAAVARYTRAADQQRMAAEAMADMNKRATEVANLPLTEVANRPAPRGKKPCG
jgi:integrase